MGATSRKIRVLLSKTVLDGHESALRYIAQTLRDAGMEVVYTRFELVDEAIKTAIEEDVDVMGLQYYGCGVMYEVPYLMGKLKEQNLDKRIKVIVGGTITPAERDKLLGLGVSEVFLPSVGKVTDIPGRIREIIGA
jgi:methylmalonyl-CoA mutase C-terminal domain/subunit